MPRKKLDERKMIKCKENTERIVKSQYGKLSRWERFGMFIHLLYCKACRLFKKQSAFIDKHAKNRLQHSLSENEKNAMKNYLKNNP